jgi:hypothetical protein
MVDGSDTIKANTQLLERPTRRLQFPYLAARAAALPA